MASHRLMRLAMVVAIGELVVSSYRTLPYNGDKFLRYIDYERFQFLMDIMVEHQNINGW